MTCCRPWPVVHAAVFVALLTAWTIALLSPVPHESARRALGGAWQVWVFGKGLHVCAYAFLAVLGGTLDLGGRRWVWVLAGLVVHGAVTEVFQPFVGRTGAVRDAALDSLGVAVGGFVVVVWRAARARQRRPAGDQFPGG
jgi:hypothetical protein